MFAHRARYFKRAIGLLALLATLAAGGCGGDATGTGETTGPGADVAGADPGDVAVISGWVEALAAGDTEGAAAYFALPSIAENGPLVTRIRTLEQAIAFNETLPCGAELISAETTGDFTTATFTLTDRPGGDCGAGIGGTAATSFVIEEGKIAEWRRVGVGGSVSGAGGSTT